MLITQDMRNSVVDFQIRSNEAVRSAELTLRLRGHEDAAQIRGLLERADEKKTRLLARLERLRGEFKLLLVERQAEIAAAAGSSLST